MIRNILLWLLSCWAAFSWAQQTPAPDTLLIELPEITIPADRIPPSLGTQRLTISYADQDLASASSLAQLLQEQSSIYIKSYGVGQLATPASRGASANHTQIAWNGIAINSPSLGQVDLSLIPAQSTAQLWLRPNPSSVQWGNGAIGGVIELENRPPPGGWRATLSSQAGSFGQWNQHLGVENTLSKWSQQTQVGRWTADNNFPYQTFTGDENRMPNASVNSTTSPMINSFNSKTMK
jgi:vitamin B12 transporter